MKFGAGCTTKVTPVVLTRDPDVIATTGTKLPAGVVVNVVRVIVIVPPPVMAVGLKDAVVPLGSAVTEGVTRPEKLLKAVAVIV